MEIEQRVPSALSGLLQSIDEKGKTELTRMIMGSAAEYDRIKKEDGLTIAVQSALAAMDESVAWHLARPESQPSTCKKGCSFCCEIYVAISEDEAAHIINLAKAHSIKIDWKKAKKQAAYAREDWIDNKKEHRSCIFLKDGLCSIYEFRPGACRNHIAHSPPEMCNVNVRRPNLVYATVIKANAILAGLWRGQKMSSLPNMLLRMRKKCGTITQ